MDRGTIAELRPLRPALLVGLALLAILAPQAQPSGPVAREVASPFSEPAPGSLAHLKLASTPRARLRAAAQQAAREATPPVVGDRRIWPALDGVNGREYLKNFTLRAIGQHIEVWVASDQDSVSKDLEFPAGDCRNDDRVQVSDAQVQYLVQQFDGNIYPKEAEAFSTPQPRAGSNALIPRRAGLPADYYAGDGGRIVALVDNIRDENFFDVNTQVGIGGVYVPSFNDDADRNIITVDGIDWLHRTGKNPPHNPAPGNLCASRNGHPLLIEATLAHEYQHLLERYQDPREVSWVNEGLSMFAESLTGYADDTTPVSEVGFSGSIQDFYGFGSQQTNANPNPSPGGPENSLTIWGDKGDMEIVSDYGAAETFMHYVAARFGLGFMTALHRDPDQGLASLRKLLAARGADAAEVLHDWAAMIALDKVLDDGAKLKGGSAARYQTPTLHASVNWDNPDSYLTAGAPPNGSDYVRLRNKSQKYLSSAQIKSISFDGSPAFPARGVEWGIDPNPLDHGGNPALHSGSGGGLDRGIVRQVKVPTTGAKLTFQTRYDLSPGLDFGFVQISPNGGKSWKSLAGSGTTATADPNATPPARRHLPGLTGRSGGGPFPTWTTATYDLSAYRGKTVLLAFHYVSDPRVAFPGWWIDDVRLGGAALSDGTTLVGWKPYSQFAPGERTGGFTVQLLGYSTKGKRALIQRLRLDARLHGQLAGPPLRRLLAGGYDVVAAIVTYDDPTESKLTYGQYVLRVNGVVQPGGEPPR